MLLAIYEEASGQKLNRDKTYIFFSRKTSQADQQRILKLSGLQATQSYDMYLSLPALVGKSKTRVFKSIKDMVWKRLYD